MVDPGIGHLFYPVPSLFTPCRPVEAWLVHLLLQQGQSGAGAAKGQPK